MTSRRGLQATLAAIGAVATVAGTSGVVRGSAEIIGGGPVSARVDNEYRFYAAWYPVFGVLLLRAARQPEREALIVRAAATGFLIAAGGRVLSIRKLGQPNSLQKVLMALEFAIPAVIIPWQAKLGGNRQGPLSARGAAPRA
jgi:hypothetical protein